MKQKHNVTVENLGIEIFIGDLVGFVSGVVIIRMGETVVFVLVIVVFLLCLG